MINLLPLQEQKELRAGKTNSLLIRYVGLAAAAVGAMVALFVLAFFQLSLTKTQAESSVETNSQKAAALADIEARTSAFESDLALAKSIMSNETHYTKLLTTLASNLPRGVVMSQVELDVDNFGTPTTLSFQADTYQTAIKLKDSLQASPMFQDVSFVSLSQGQEGSTTYPFTVQLNLTIAKSAGGV